MSLKVLIAEDEKLLAQLLTKQLSESIPGVIVETVHSVAQLAELSTETVDVAVVDLALSDGSALNWVRGWSDRHPYKKAIVLTSRDEDFVLHGVFNSSVAGFVHKMDGLEFLEMAIRTVMAGGTFFSPRIQAMRSKLSSDPNFFAKILSEREQHVLKLVGDGFNSAEIAQLLGLKNSTVLDHRKNIMQKLNLHSQSELMAYALRKGFSDLNGRGVKAG